ncbi:and other transporter-domain-containing protein [Leucosporidium creatinivorum]|uniref:And other transporter-domain-containing protein n=1 Tax=Leucosporidium creatinivorum TaxID=106004 RepID=A0A1Y2FHV9_9BASI|nr:and other transporter-domain-containing protein [Leucosporidium creatinivorum]
MADPLAAPNPRRLVGNALLMATSCFASLGVFLFGFDQGVMSGIITGPYFKAYFHRPNRYELATMVAILEIGALVTSLLSGRVGDIFGRRKTLLAGALIFTLGGMFQTFTTGFKVMVFGRILSGFGVGFLSMIVPVYQSEISPADHRGKLACIEFTGNIIGYASSVWIDYFASFLLSDLSWRGPLFVQCIIGSILAIGSLVIPESPRWLLDMDMDEEGMRVLADLHGEGDPENEVAREEFREIKENVLAERLIGDRSYKAMFTRYKFRVFIAMSAQAFAQLNGINVISYYAPLVFESAGWIGRDAILMTGINGLIYVLSTIPTWYLVDIWGRRPILLSGALIMAFALSSVGYFLYLDKSYTPTAVVVSVITFNAAFGFSWGPIPWLFPPEILPLAFRVKGVSLSTATNWAFNFIVGEATPILQEAIRWRLYTMHAGFCLVSFVCVYFLYPETMGVPLEEMDALFGDSSSRDLESASLVRSHTPSHSTDPPTLAKRASEAHAHLPPNASAPSLWAGMMGWFSGAAKGKGSGRQGVANYQSVRSGETDVEGEESG